MRRLARVDLAHGLQGVLDIVAEFRGALELLPRPDFADSGKPGQGLFQARPLAGLQEQESRLLVRRPDRRHTRRRRAGRSAFAVDRYAEGRGAAQPGLHRLCLRLRGQYAGRRGGGRRTPEDGRHAARRRFRHLGFGPPAGHQQLLVHAGRARRAGGYGSAFSRPRRAARTRHHRASADHGAGGTRHGAAGDLRRRAGALSDAGRTGARTAGRQAAAAPAQGAGQAAASRVPRHGLALRPVARHVRPLRERRDLRPPRRRSTAMWWTAP